MKTITSILLFVSIISCQAPQKSFFLESFKDFPPEIDGCSCYFSANQADFDKGIYLYMNNYFELAFIKIDGELITLKKVDSDNSSKESSEWINDKYSLSLEKSQQSTTDETIQYSGSLTLKKGGTTVVNKDGLVGECGC